MSETALILSLSALVAFISVYFSLGKPDNEDYPEDGGSYLQPLRQWLGIDIKPFNCVTCLSGWGGLMLWGGLFLVYGNDAINYAYCVYTTIVFSLILWRLIP